MINESNNYEYYLRYTSTNNVGREIICGANYSSMHQISTSVTDSIFNSDHKMTELVMYTDDLEMLNTGTVKIPLGDQGFIINVPVKDMSEFDDYETGKTPVDDRYQPEAAREFFENYPDPYWSIQKSTL